MQNHFIFLFLCSKEPESCSTNSVTSALLNFVKRCKNQVCKDVNTNLPENGILVVKKLLLHGYSHSQISGLFYEK